MNRHWITTYSGFSKVSGRVTPEELFQLISSATYAHHIRKIEWLMQAGESREAANVKRQLPFFTVTAHYGESRLPESITGYNDLITIDIDGLSEEQVAALRPIIEQDEATVGNFLTPKRHGYKIIAHPTGEDARKLRREYLCGETIGYDRLEEYHGKMYELTRKHYEERLQVEVDTSGKDISRGIFGSYDPQAFFSPERLAKALPMTAKIIAPEAKPKRKRTVAPAGVATGEPPEAGTEKRVININPLTQLEFNKCVASVRRSISYEAGSHNPFLFALGNKCFARGLDEAEVRLLAAHRFGENGKRDTDTPIGNGYTYVSKTEKAEKEKKNQLPPFEQTREFLIQRYRFRRNVLLDRLEFMNISPDETPKGFQTLAAKDMNTIFVKLNEASITYGFNNLKAIVDSDYATPFDPFVDYFNALPRWDGVTDHIGMLAASVQTTDQPYWNKVFRRWLAGMVQCAMGTEHINQQALILYGKQGKGKSSWIRNLLPPELREYYRNGMVNPAYKDDMLMLSNRIIINMEEFEGTGPSGLAELKRILSQESVTLRKPYEIQARTYRRRASFVGSTNNTCFLNDIGGSRRFLVVQAMKIDYQTEIDYKGLYGQVMHLIENGFRHWSEGEEIDEINRRNERFRMKDPLEENLYVYCRPGDSENSMVKWKPAAAILAYLSGIGRTLANTQSQQLLIQILERDGFMKRTNEYGITEYGVITLTVEEIEGYAKRKAS